MFEDRLGVFGCNRANKFRKSIPPGALNHGMFPANAQSELPSLFAVEILLRLVAE
jgi:hypothetical protein